MRRRPRFDVEAEPAGCGLPVRSLSPAAAPRASLAWLLWVASLFLVLSTGCQESEPIITYRVPTELPAQLREERSRMLSVMFPAGDDVWFFKVTGPESAVALIDGPFRDFVRQIQLDDQGPVLDVLPAGWRRAGGNRQFRFASINIDTPGKQLDLSVSKLARQGDWDSQVAMNVNRWRGQLGLEPSEQRWAGGESLQIEAADGDGVWVDLVGDELAGGSMSPPFAGGGLPPDHPPVGDVTREGGSAASAEQGPPPTTAEAAEPSDSPLSFDSPPGWRAGRMSSMRLAAFSAGPEDAAAEITVIPAGGDLAGNVRRWMGQIRQETVTDEQLQEALDAGQEWVVSDRPASRYILQGDEQTIDATIVPLEGNMSLFIKMQGPRETVAGEAEALESFLKSLQYNR